MRTSIVVFICILSIQLLGQTCLVDGLTFERQSQIDSFSINYPNCEHVLGSLIVDSPNNAEITNLEGFVNLKRINNLALNYNSDLTSLFGLHNVERIDSSLGIVGNHKLKDLTGLNSLISVGNRFTISTNDSLVNLLGVDSLRFAESLNISQNQSLLATDGLYALDTIRQFINIGSNGSLEHITMNNLKYVGLEFAISGNDNLDSLNGFSDLEYVQNIKIEYNSNLKIIDGFDAMTGSSMWINYNDNLQSINGFSALTNAGDIWINGNEKLSNINALENLEQCFAMRLSGNNQIQQIVGFNKLKTVEYLELNLNSDLSSITGFSELDSVNFEMEITGNFLLRDISGFSGMHNIYNLDIRDTQLESFDEFNLLETIGALELTNNNRIKNLQGFEQLNYADNISIVSNDSLTNLTGLDSLLKVDLYFSMGDNPIDDISALSKLESVGGVLSIFDSELTELEGLSSLTILGGLWLIQNNKLTTLDGLMQVDPTTINVPWQFNSLELKANNELVTCNQNFICAWLNYPDVSFEISDNKTDCFDEQSVRSSCINSAIHSKYKIDVNIFPNPVVDILYISSDRNSNYTITNGNGSKVLQGSLTEGQNIINLYDLTSGSYFLHVVNEEYNVTKLMSKL